MQSVQRALKIQLHEELPSRAGFVVNGLPCNIANNGWVSPQPGLVRFPVNTHVFPLVHKEQDPPHLLLPSAFVPHISSGCVQLFRVPTRKPTSKFDFSLARAVLQLEVLKTFLVVGTVYKTSPLPRQVQLLQVENVPLLSLDAKKVDH